MKLVVNSAYGYLAAGGGLTRFADVHAANEVTRRGREVLDLMCRELADRGVTLLEADTDGVYFSVPDAWTEADERRVVAEVAALLPPLVQLEFDGRYAAMLSHEPKNYALLGYDGPLVLRGVAFRSSRAEPFGEAFLRRALARLLDRRRRRRARGVRRDRRGAAPPRTLPTYDVSSRVRLTKTPRTLPRRARRRGASCPTKRCSASGRTTWTTGERVRVYRTNSGSGGAASAIPTSGGRRGAAPIRATTTSSTTSRVLRDTFAARLARALTPEDFAAVVRRPGQPSLFEPSLAESATVLTRLGGYRDALVEAGGGGVSGSA